MPFNTDKKPETDKIKTCPSGIIDSHAHVVKEFFADDQSEVIERAFNHGVSHMVNPGVQVEDIPELLALAEKHEKISIGVGQHPHEAKHFTSDFYDKMVDAVKNPKVVAIGECGLDFHYNNSDRESQLHAFKEQIRMARTHSKPIIVHCRDAWQEAFQLIEEEGKGEVQGVFHCFTGGPELIPDIKRLGFYVSFSGIVTFPNAKDIQAAAPLVPDDRVLVETDCPFLAPQKVRGNRNEPVYVWLVAEKIAELRNSNLEEVARLASENARRLFNLT